MKNLNLHRIIPIIFSIFIVAGLFFIWQGVMLILDTSNDAVSERNNDSQPTISYQKENVSDENESAIIDDTFDETNLDEGVSIDPRPLLPDDLEIITKDNVSQIKLLGTLGNGKILDIAWSPDEKYFAVCSSLSIEIFDTSSWKKIKSFLNSDYISGVDFSFDGKHLITIGSTINFWNLEDWSLKNLLISRGGALTSNSKSFLATWGDGLLNVYNIDTENTARVLSVPIDEENLDETYFPIIFLENDEILAINYYGQFELWEITTNSKLASNSIAQEEIYSNVDLIQEVPGLPEDFDCSGYLVSPNDRYISCHPKTLWGGDYFIYIFDMQTRKFINLNIENFNTIFGIAFSSNGENFAIQSSGNNSGPRLNSIWSFPEGELVSSGIGNFHFIGDSLITYQDPNSQTVDIVDNSGEEIFKDNINILELSNSKYIGTLMYPGVPEDDSAVNINKYAFSPLGNFGATYHGNGEIIIWDLLTFEIIIKFNKESVNHLIFSDDEKILALYNQENKYELIEISSGNSLSIQDYLPEGFSIFKSNLDSDSDYLGGVKTIYSKNSDLSFNMASSTSPSSVNIIDRSSEEILYSFENYGIYWNQTIFSPKGDLIVTSSSSGVVGFWGVSNDPEVDLEIESEMIFEEFPVFLEMPTTEPSNPTNYGLILKSLIINIMDVDELSVDYQFFEGRQDTPLEIEKHNLGKVREHIFTFTDPTFCSGNVPYLEYSIEIYESQAGAGEAYDLPIEDEGYLSEFDNKNFKVREDSACGGITEISLIELVDGGIVSLVAYIPGTGLAKQTIENYRMYFYPLVFFIY